MSLSYRRECRPTSRASRRLIGAPSSGCGAGGLGREGGGSRGRGHCGGEGAWRRNQVGLSVAQGRRDLLCAVRRWADAAPPGFRLLGGDWNFMPTEAGMAEDGTEVRSTDRTGEVFERMFESVPARLNEVVATPAGLSPPGTASTASTTKSTTFRRPSCIGARRLWAAFEGKPAQRRFAGHGPCDEEPEMASTSPVPPHIFAVPHFW